MTKFSPSGQLLEKYLKFKCHFQRQMNGLHALQQTEH